ncbi:hypothetical protein C8Q79DRAFT_924527 [Trametes meyenii]|nr:hypothetical protein C8Q79DRAFT_924527 [Trametes meyenii]
MAYHAGSTAYLDMTCNINRVPFYWILVWWCAVYSPLSRPDRDAAVVTTAQSGWYFRHYPKDRPILRLLVATIWILDAVHLGLYIATMFTYLVYKKAAYFGREPLPWTSNIFDDSGLLTPVVVGIRYLFDPVYDPNDSPGDFTHRAFGLAEGPSHGHGGYLRSPIQSIFVAATWGSHTYELTSNAHIQVFSIGKYFPSLPPGPDRSFAVAVLFVKSILTDTVAQYVFLAPFDLALSAMSASTDVLLCSALFILLFKSRTGTAGANRLINKLMLYTIHTGVLTSIFAILSMIMVLVLPRTSLFVMFYYIGARLYSVSLLATLNGREGLRVEAEKMGQLSLPNIKITSPGLSKVIAASGPLSPPHEIVVTRVHCTTPSTTNESVSSDGVFLTQRTWRRKVVAMRQDPAKCLSSWHWEGPRASCSNDSGGHHMHVLSGPAASDPNTRKQPV